MVPFGVTSKQHVIQVIKCSFSCAIYLPGFSAALLGAAVADVEEVKLLQHSAVTEFTSHLSVQTGNVAFTVHWGNVALFNGGTWHSLFNGGMWLNSLARHEEWNQAISNCPTSHTKLQTSVPLLSLCQLNHELGELNQQIAFQGGAIIFKMQIDSSI